MTVNFGVSIKTHYNEYVNCPIPANENYYNEYVKCLFLSFSCKTIVNGIQMIDLLN